MNFSDFEFIRTLGTGSFGRVKLVRYMRDGNLYAVKQMKKSEIIRLRQVDHINAERSILQQISHPFIVNMKAAFKDNLYLYIAMECVSGGELFTHLRRQGKFSNEQAVFYAAQIACAFDYIHSQNIVHRDLKPENILIDREGYAKLTDFGFAKILSPGSRAYTLCGTPEYIAPEVLLGKGHGAAVDWWTLGILIYEMLVGQPPFCDDEPMGIYQKILTGKVYFPKYVDKSAKTLVKSLLQADLSKRFGNLQAGSKDILESAWFGSVKLDKLLTRQIAAPFKPFTRSEADMSNFDAVAESEDLTHAVISHEEDPFINW